MYKIYAEHVRTVEAERNLERQARRALLRRNFELQEQVRALKGQLALRENDANYVVG